MHRYPLRNTAARRYRLFDQQLQIPAVHLDPVQHINPNAMADQNPQGHQDNAAEANPPQADHPDGGLAPEGQPPPGPAAVIAAADEAIPLAPAQAAPPPPVHAIPLPPWFRVLSPSQLASE